MTTTASRDDRDGDGDGDGAGPGAGRCWAMPGPDPAGPWLYCLRVPPLGPKDYARMQALVVAPAVDESAGGNLLRALAVGAAAVAAPVALAAALGAELALSLEVPSLGVDLWLGTPGTWLALAGAALLVLAAQRAAAAWWRAWLLRRLHGTATALHDAHALRPGEDGFAWSDANGTALHGWAAVRAFERAGSVQYMFLDSHAAVWLPDAALPGGGAGSAEADAVLGFVRDRIAHTRRVAGGAGGEAARA